MLTLHLDYRKITIDLPTEFNFQVHTIVTKFTSNFNLLVTEP